MPKIPVDFTEKAKIPPAVGGTGYPYRISAKDLMQDFVYASLEVNTEAHSSGLALAESKTTGQGGHAGRKISLTGTLVPIEFYCWKDGVVGTIKLTASQDFKALPPA